MLSFGKGLYLIVLNTKNSFEESFEKLTFPRWHEE
jgi:hypothetical protein